MTLYTRLIHQFPRYVQFLRLEDDSRTAKPVLSWLQSLSLRKLQRKLAEYDDADAVVLFAFLWLVNCSQTVVNARSQEKRGAVS